MASSVIRMVLKMKDEASSAIKGTSEEARGARVNVAALASGLAVVGAAAVTAATSFVALTSHVMDLRNEITDASTRTGLANTTLAGLRLAAEGSGQSFGNLNRTLASFTKSIADAGDGTGETVKIFEKMGVSVRDEMTGNLRAADDVLRDLLGTISEVEDPTERAALAAQAFGTQGTKLLQALGDPANLDHFVEQARIFGVDVGPKAAKAAADWQQSTALFKSSLEGAGDKIVQAFGGESLAGILRFAAAFNVQIGESAPLAMEHFVTSAGFMLQALNRLFHWDFDGVKSILTDFENFSIEHAKRIVEANKRIAEAFEASKKAATGSTIPAITGTGTTATTGATGAAAASGEGGWVEQMLGRGAEMMEARQEYLSSGMEAVGDALGRWKVGIDETAATQQEMLDTMAGTAISLGGGALTGDPMSSLAQLGGPFATIASGLSLLAEIGEDGITEISEKLTETGDNIIAGLKNLPPLIGDILPKKMIEFIPEFVQELAEQIPSIMAAAFLTSLKLWGLLVALPFIIIKSAAEGLAAWWVKAWGDIKDWFSNAWENLKNFLLEIFTLGAANTGASVNVATYTRSAESAAIRSAGGSSGRFGSPVQVVINTAVVDPDTIPALARELERHMGAFGRGTMPAFGVS